MHTVYKLYFRLFNTRTEFLDLYPLENALLELIINDPAACMLVTLTFLYKFLPRSKNGFKQIASETYHKRWEVACHGQASHIPSRFMQLKPEQVPLPMIHWETEPFHIRIPYCS